MAVAATAHLVESRIRVVLFLRTAGLWSIANVFVQDNEWGGLWIESAFERSVNDAVDSPGLDAGDGFNLVVIQLNNKLESKHLSARSHIVVHHCQMGSMDLVSLTRPHVANGEGDQNTANRKRVRR